MAKQLQLRRGTESQHNSFRGASGEVTVDTTNKTLRVHDGSTVGGTRLAKHSEIPTVPTNVSAFTNDAGYLTQHQSLEDYATKAQLSDYLPKTGGNITSSLTIQNNTVLTTVNGLPLSGGTMTGAIRSSTGSGAPAIHNISNGVSGCQLWLFDKGNSTYHGGAIIRSQKDDTGYIDFRALGNGSLSWNGIDISAMGMPSGTYINPTLPASGGTVTAPADGWFFLRRVSTATNQVVDLASALIESTLCSSSSGQTLSIFLPCKKGQSVVVRYNAPTAGAFTFIYANGSVWEKA